MSRPIENLSRSALATPSSGIVGIMNYGRERPGLIPLWAGEGDLATPRFIADAATRSLAAGETFYTWQRGIPELRSALADYFAGLYGRPFDPEAFFVTGSGMQSIQIALQAVMDAGEEIIVPTPAWPNVSAAALVMGARPVEVAMTFDGGRWALDLPAIQSAVTPATRAIFINSPSNPSGWVADHATLRAVLDLARTHGMWIIADEIYARFHWGEGGGLAPSFLDVADADDLILYVNTFSKNWAMTGWRVGWIMAPAEIGDVLENLIQYSTSGVATFMQRAGVAALREGEGFVEHLIQRARHGREIVMDAIGDSNRVEIAPPDGAFYALFAVDGAGDAQTLARRLVDEANIGLAPGTAFGPGAERFVRLCFLRSEAGLREAMDRLVRWLNAT